MSEVSPDDLGRVRWYPSGEKQLETISDEISIIKTSDNGTHVNIGNTGLVFRFGNFDNEGKYDITADFVPGGNVMPDVMAPATAAKALAFGMNAFTNWLKTTSEIDRSKIKYLKADTNETFGTFIADLFKKFHEDKLVTFEGRDLQLDLDAVLNLKPDSPLMSYISKISKRASTMKFMAITPTPIEEPQI